MGTAKDIRLKPITAKRANAFIKKYHYSGKVVPNSQLHIGVTYRGELGGVMQFGPSLDKRKTIQLVRDTAWAGALELNRMAMLDELPKNCASRALAVAMRLLKKYKPDLEWVISFADATQCGDGTMYRAAGAILTGIKRSANLARLSDGTVIHKMTLESNPTAVRRDGKSYYDVTGGRYAFKKYVETYGGVVLPGYQIRYVFFLNESARKRLTVPEIPYSRLREMGIDMYKGKPRATSIDSDVPAVQAGEGGASPTVALFNQLGE